MRGSRRAAFLLAILLTLPTLSIVTAREYHVNAGNRQSDDSNPGTDSQPWKSLHKANSTVEPGDTVYIHAGRYTQRIAPINSGHTSRPIVFEAWKNDDVYLSENAAKESCIDLTNRACIHIRRINVRFPGGNYPAYATMVGAQHCRIENCNFSGSKTAYHGILLGDHNADRATSHNVFQSVSFKGCSGDLVLMRGDSHHNLIRTVIFRMSNHGITMPIS